MPLDAERSADEDLAHRRPLKSRGTGWAQGVVRILLKTAITPNMISVFGIAFAGIGAAAMVFADRSGWLWLVAAVGIQLRLLANMLDGMVAVEGGRGSPTGPVFNEVPDRVEDTLLLVAAGFAAGCETLGWVAALLAMLTAYIRVLGGSFGLAQDFRGPMAKPHRMAMLTAASVAEFLQWWFGIHYSVMLFTLAAIVLGAAVTATRRTMRIAALLRGETV